MSPLFLNVGLLVVGVGILYIGAEWLVRGSSRLATSLGISPIVVGLTVVSFGTSAPELVVALIAALNDNSDLAMGNVMGSNLANIGLILGITAIVRPMDVAARVVSREIPVMLALTILLFPLAQDGNLGLIEGIALFTILLFYLAFINSAAGEEAPEIGQAFEEYAGSKEALTTRVAWMDFVLVILGSTGLVLGGTAIVRSAEFVATSFGISDVIVGLTLVAIGTSLPELATALVAAIRGEADIAVGNIIGSNIFNIAAILGITSMVTPITVSPAILSRELPAVLLLSLIVLPVTRIGLRVYRWEGVILLVSYFTITGWLILF
ncbi:MAG TPA: calcium/sodium antiporter [Longimicrobiales bacterium]|nr:calcium/sodium antiporter [Longimicrobiales bacterium]